MNHNIAILVPGVMGSCLRDGEGVIWPGSYWEYVAGLSDANFQRLLGENVEPSGIIRDYWPRRIYNDLIEPLEREYSFQLLADTSSLPDEGQNGLLIFAYDWRRDNREAAERLADFVDSIQKTATQQGKQVTLSLLCHSMGGLVARYYLESQKLERRGGLRAISKVIFMGTPHQGAPEALLGITGQRPKLWMTAAQTQELASRPEYNAAYQLLPTSQLPFFLRNVAQDGMQPQSLYDGTVIEALQLLDGSMDTGRVFHDELRPEQLMRSGLDVFNFYSSVHKTTSFVEFIDREPNPMTGTAHDLNVYELASAGDGTVPVHSAFFAGALNIPVEKEHEKIFASNRIIRLLAYILLNEDQRIAMGHLPRLMSFASTERNEERDYAPLRSFLTLDSIASLPAPPLRLTETTPTPQHLASAPLIPQDDAVVVALHSHLLPPQQELNGVLVLHGLLLHNRINWRCDMTLTRIMTPDGAERADEIGQCTVAVSGATEQTIAFDWPGKDLIQLTPGEYRLTHTLSATTQDQTIPEGLETTGEVRFLVRDIPHRSQEEPTESTPVTTSSILSHAETEAGTTTHEDNIHKPVVDIHAHTFNATDVATTEYLIEGLWLHNSATQSSARIKKIVKFITENILLHGSKERLLKEGEFLQELLKQTKEKAANRDSEENWERLRQELQDEGRTVDQIVEDIMQDPDSNIEDFTEPESRHSIIKGLTIFLSCMLQYRVKTTAMMIDAFDEVELFTPSVIDFGLFGENNDENPILTDLLTQMNIHETISEISAYGPFFGTERQVYIHPFSHSTPKTPTVSHGSNKPSKNKDISESKYILLWVGTQIQPSTPKSRSFGKGCKTSMNIVYKKISPSQHIVVQPLTKRPNYVMQTTRKSGEKASSPNTPNFASTLGILGQEATAQKMSLHGQSSLPISWPNMTTCTPISMYTPSTKTI